MPQVLSPSLITEHINVSIKARNRPSVLIHGTNCISEGSPHGSSGGSTGVGSTPECQEGASLVEEAYPRLTEHVYYSTEKIVCTK